MLFQYETKGKTTASLNRSIAFFCMMVVSKRQRVLFRKTNLCAKFETSLEYFLKESAVACLASTAAIILLSRSSQFLFLKYLLVRFFSFSLSLGWIMPRDYIAFVIAALYTLLSMGIDECATPKRIGNPPFFALKEERRRRRRKKRLCGKRRPPPFTSSTPRCRVYVIIAHIVHTNSTTCLFFPWRNTRKPSVGEQQQQQQLPGCSIGKINDVMRAVLCLRLFSVSSFWGVGLVWGGKWTRLPHGA